MPEGRVVYDVDVRALRDTIREQAQELSELRATLAVLRREEVARNKHNEYLAGRVSRQRALCERCQAMGVVPPPELIEPVKDL